MPELSEKQAKKQFKKFVNEYNKLHDSNYIWSCRNPIQNDNWDFSGKDGESILKIQYTEAIPNHQQKANVEASKRGEHEFNFAIGQNFATQQAEEAYIRKLKMADKNIILLVGFHDFTYERNNKYDGVEKIRQHIKRKFKKCLFRELWTINLDDSICDLIF